MARIPADLDARQMTSITLSGGSTRCLLAGHGMDALGVNNGSISTVVWDADAQA